MGRDRQNMSIVIEYESKVSLSDPVIEPLIWRTLLNHDDVICGLQGDSIISETAGDGYNS